MGQVIRLHRDGNIDRPLDDPGFAMGCELSKDEAARIVSGCLEMRRQIALLLELAVQADKIIDGVSDAAVQGLLREKSTRSHVELIGALAQISSTITSLASAFSKDGIRPASGCEAESPS